ncbi:Uncharacterized protein GBIM_11249 [Gryllus bimaculatus]|nr:Uncharacterized protein GBIM_11249 [Gryllus bimaculatus]
MLKGLEPDMKIVMDAQRWFPGAGWKTFYPLEETDICENACEHFPEFMSGVFEAMGLTADKENLANTCPIPAGEYISKPMKVKYQFSKFPELPYGEARGILSFMDGDERTICLIVGGEVVPEDSAKGIDIDDSKWN